ncbi:hypothetical protein LSH36_1355g00002 [Paralvinella palmiformis]|uniref:Fibronectin type-III domain-containing protein n=1 Tax=Paralvinella palmiformis TaxID=53620 RepID=A0AAD9MPC4_9ANNE|nr:hypothetical protein LSH36_1355g00002 [Paralvinella palmiformis]
MSGGGVVVSGGGGGGGGNTTETDDVIENTTLVNRTCSADCNPECSYIWINNTNGVNISYTPLLNKPDRYDAGSYSCKTYNKYGERNKTFTLKIKFVENDYVTFSCNVISNPVSDIKLYNMTDNKTLFTWNNVNEAEYHFSDVHCLDTGQFMFTTKNDIPDMHHKMKSTAYVDIMLKRLIIVAKLIITDARTINHGNYSRVAGNNFGNMTPVTLSIVPEGPPMTPSAPRLMEISAVSTQINWTAGFNGGFEQRFAVLYRGEGDDIEKDAKIDTDPEVNKGDIVVYTLNDETTVQSNTTYNIRIKAENDFQGHSVVYGEMDRFKTLVKAVFTKDPEITILEGRAEIHFIISGPLTYILEENCVMDTTHL